MKLKKRSTPIHHRGWNFWWIRHFRGNILSSLRKKKNKSTRNGIEGNKPEEIKDKSSFVSITIDKDGTHILPDEDGICLLAANIVNNIPAMPSPASFIYRVPARLRVVNVKKYEPRIVSIGPFHRGMKNLRISKEHKKWYLCDLVTRSAQENTNSHDVAQPISNFVQEIVKAVWKIEINARTCYAEKFELERDKFIKMMILDGCFILELLYRYKEYQEKTKEERELMHSKDPIFSAAWMVRTLQRDLVLLENQIPFIVLETLFNLTKDPRHNWTLKELAFNFLDSELPTILQSSTNITCKPLSDVVSDNMITGHHLLDLIRNRLLRGPKPEEYGVFPTWSFTQYSASDLKEFGIRFRKKENCLSLFDITFKESGVLEIPHFFYGEGVTILLPNLIALEQCHRQYTDHIASYAILLDSLINSKEDVKLLRGKGIIDVYWNEDEKIASEINSLCKGVKIDAFYYDDLCFQVRNYCGKKRHKWGASLTQNHFRTPWAIISIIAAFILLVLAITQTVFSII